jgi:putative CocE/NonD family hydrolase
MVGGSYAGFYTAAGIIDAHPALKAACPQAPVTDWFTGDDWHHNGALMLPHAFSFMASFGHPRPQPTTKSTSKALAIGTPDGYAFFLKLGPLANVNARYFKDDVPFWNEMMQHGTFDEFWKARNIRPHLRNIKPAVMTVGGWFDAENMFGALETYKSVEANSPGATNILVMGPWRHGGWSRGGGSTLGPLAFGSNTAEFFRQKIEFPFFQHHLKDKGSPSFPEAWVFETGANEWRTYDAWPPRNAQKRSLFLQAGGGLAFDSPASSGEPAFDEYVSDPARPVEYIDQISIRMTPDYMTQDQRAVSRRPDVLLYEGPALTEDVTIAGPIQARLFVSTSGTDSDWIVKLVDVYPDNSPSAGANATSVRFGGFEQLVRGDVMRGKFRNSLEKPEPFTPNQPTALNFSLQDITHTFRKAHKIMVQIQSTWFPLVDRNPQKFVDIYSAKESDFQKATQRVYRNNQMASHIELLVVPH